MAVVSQYNNTLLLITPRVDTIIGSAFTLNGTTASIMLHEAETLLVANTSDLTGTVVLSTKPIALFSGHGCANVPALVTACDHLVEQIPPVSTWGSSLLLHH